MHRPYISSPPPGVGGWSECLSVQWSRLCLLTCSSSLNPLNSQGKTPPVPSPLTPARRSPKVWKRRPERERRRKTNKVSPKLGHSCPDQVTGLQDVFGRLHSFFFPLLNRPCVQLLICVCVDVFGL